MESGKIRTKWWKIGYFTKVSKDTKLGYFNIFIYTVLADIVLKKTLPYHYTYLMILLLHINK